MGSERADTKAPMEHEDLCMPCSSVAGIDGSLAKNLEQWRSEAFLAIHRFLTKSKIIKTRRALDECNKIMDNFQRQVLKERASFGRDLMDHSCFLTASEYDELLAELEKDFLNKTYGLKDQLREVLRRALCGETSMADLEMYELLTELVEGLTSNLYRCLQIIFWVEHALHVRAD
jgi:hypothetical protein